MCSSDLGGCHPVLPLIWGFNAAAFRRRFAWHGRVQNQPLFSTRNLPAPHRANRPEAGLSAFGTALALAAPAAFSGCSSLGPAEPLWTPRALTKPGEFTPGIEGPACDRKGSIYAVNFKAEGTIGRVTPDGKGEVWVTLPAGSVGNGIVFNREGVMFVADYTRHNVLRIDMSTRKVEVFAHQPEMNQPNDLAISADGTLWASDPN